MFQECAIFDIIDRYAKRYVIHFTDLISPVTQQKSWGCTAKI